MDERRNPYDALDAGPPTAPLSGVIDTAPDDARNVDAQTEAIVTWLNQGFTAAAVYDHARNLGIDELLAQRTIDVVLDERKAALRAGGRKKMWIGGGLFGVSALFAATCVVATLLGYGDGRVIYMSGLGMAGLWIFMQGKNEAEA
ncbi:MAG: hypothetical protein QM811_29290 [Pirellulales bacterium]